jgi:predicted O-linked N-acetylglucosamine transferase (SPINDLY family)
MSYYKDYYAVQAMFAKQREYALTKQLALSEIQKQLNDVQTARSLLYDFVQKYKTDKTIYLSVNEITSGLKAYDILTESAQKALACEPLNPQSHYDFGTLLLESKCGWSTGDVLVRYLEILNEDYSGIARSEGSSERSLDRVEETFRSKAKLAHDYLRLGNFLTFARRLRKAAIAFKQATNLKHDCGIAWRGLSLVSGLLECPGESSVAMAQSNFLERKYALAIEDYTKVLSIGEKSPELYERLAQSYLHVRQFSQAATICSEGMLKNKSVTLYTLWIDALQSINQIQQALRVAEVAYEAFPQEQYFQFQARLILPVIYQSEQDISKHRARFCQTLQAWSQRCQDSNFVSSSTINDIKGTNFYLPYQGQCDLDIQEKYGRLLHNIAATACPKFKDKVLPRRFGKNSCIRIGYISAFCNWHTIGKLFLGWVQGHEPETFEVYVYHLGARVDFISEAFKASSKRFVHYAGRDLNELCETIGADKPDILVHLEFGMSPFATKVAALRLAPIQCLAWGHPVSSGLPTMDYFISSELMEPANGDEHYSEALIRLPNVGVCVPQPPRSDSNKTRADYGLSDDRTVYVFPHSLFKQLPQYDWVFAAIAKQNPKSEFAFIERETHSIEVTRAFEARVAVAFRRQGLDAAEYLRFVPEQGLQDFLSLLSLSDVYLDCIGWSGGMTTLEALGRMLPIVTIPGKFMRGRHAYGCLKRIGICETVVQSAEDYVNVSARLGRDEAWKREILFKQASGLHKLYDDRECVAGLERFYKAVTIGGSARSMDANLRF